MSESDYISETEYEEELDLLECSDNDNNDISCVECEGDTYNCNDAFYKLHSQFEDLNMKTIISHNVIELLKEVKDEKHCDKILNLATSSNSKPSTSKK